MIWALVSDGSDPEDEKGLAPELETQAETHLVPQSLTWQVTLSVASFALKRNWPIAMAVC